MADAIAAFHGIMLSTPDHYDAVVAPQGHAIPNGEHNCSFYFVRGSQLGFSEIWESSAEMSYDRIRAQFLGAIIAQNLLKLATGYGKPSNAFSLHMP